MDRYLTGSQAVRAFALCAAVAMAVFGCGDAAAENAAAGPALEKRPEAVLSGLGANRVAHGLNPPFDPDITRYSVRLAPGSESLALTPTAEHGLSIVIDDSPAPSGYDFSIENVTSGHPLVIVVRDDDGNQREYEIVPLPFDFPDIEATLVDPGVSSGPIYLTLRGPDSNYVAAIDNYGVPEFFRSEANFSFDFKRHPNGQHSYAVATDATSENRDPSVQHVVLDENYVEIGRTTSVGLRDTDHHEYLRLENGNEIVLAYELNLRDLRPRGGKGFQIVEDSIIQEIDSSGQVVFQWNSWDSINVRDELRGNQKEYAHVNSVFVDADGDWIVSARGTSEVLKISRETGEVEWRLGGKSNEFTFINDPFSNLCGQHTVSRLDNGNILIFDNGQFCWPEVYERGELTRIVEYEIDEEERTATLIWTYSQEGVYSDAAGSAQRLDNGNTLIGWGLGPGVLVTEVDSEGKKVLEMTARVGLDFVRSYRAAR